MKLQMTSFSSLVGVVQAGKIIIEEGLFSPLGVCLFELIEPMSWCVLDQRLITKLSQLVCLYGGQGTTC